MKPVALFADGVERIAGDVSANVAGFCIDSGHSNYAGPCRRARTLLGGIDYIHVKDIDQAVFEWVMRIRIRFFDACAQGAMCPIGEGVIDYPAIRAFLAQKNFGGFITVEQESDPRSSGGLLCNVKQSRDYLASVGF